MTEQEIDRLVAVAVAELRRQEETSGCTVMSEGKFAQVDGSFDVPRLVQAVVEAGGLCPNR